MRSWTGWEVGVEGTMEWRRPSTEEMMYLRVEPGGLGVRERVISENSRTESGRERRCKVLERRVEKIRDETRRMETSKENKRGRTVRSRFDDAVRE